MADRPHLPGGRASTLCFGCRAEAALPASPSDIFPGDATPEGTEWEEFLCSRCGVVDVRLVLASDE